MKCFGIRWVVLFHLQLVCMLSIGISANHCQRIFGTKNMTELGQELENASSAFLKVLNTNKWEGKSKWMKICPLESEPNEQSVLHISTSVLQKYISILQHIETERETKVKELCTASLLNSCNCTFNNETDESIKLNKVSERLCEVWHNFNNTSKFEGSESIKLDANTVRSLSVANVVKVIEHFGACLRENRENCENKVLKRCWRGKGTARKWRKGKKGKGKKGKKDRKDRKGRKGSRKGKKGKGRRTKQNQ